MGEVSKIKINFELEVNISGDLDCKNYSQDEIKKALDRFPTAIQELLLENLENELENASILVINKVK